METKDFDDSKSAASENEAADKIGKKLQNPIGCGGIADKKPQSADLEGDGDPFACLKDASLKLKPKADDYPELPKFLDRRARNS